MPSRIIGTRTSSGGVTSLDAACTVATRIPRTAPRHRGMPHPLVSLVAVGLRMRPEPRRRSSHLWSCWSTLSLYIPGDLQLARHEQGRSAEHGARSPSAFLLLPTAQGNRHAAALYEVRPPRA